MDTLKKIYRFFKEKYELVSLKKYTTIAGTLVFFFIMSIMPLSFWLSLLIGKLPIDLEQVLGLSVFESVKNILLYVQKEATNATASVSFFLVITTLYSSTNLFYQMRRSGEIIYEFKRRKRGVNVRLGALLLVFIVMIIVVLFLLLFALGSFLFSQIFSGAWAIVAEYALLAAVSFLLVLLLNTYVCPYKTSIRRFLPGTVLTICLWALAIVGFSVYIRFGNVRRLYGALSVIIVFLLWLYVLTTCFIIGVIFNSESITEERKKERKRKRDKNLERAHTKRMKSVIKSSLLAGVLTLFFLFPNLKSGKLTDITKPYLGEYECKQALLGEEDCLKRFDNIVLELKPKNEYALSYKEDGGKKRTVEGQYEYDDEKGILTLKSENGQCFKRSFPLKDGILYITLRIGEKTLSMQFEKK